MKDVEVQHFEKRPPILDPIFLVRLFCENEINHYIRMITTRRVILNSTERYRFTMLSVALFLMHRWKEVSVES